MKITDQAILKRPGAFVPIAMSLGALTTIPVFIAWNGTAPRQMRVQLPTSGSS